MLWTDRAHKFIRIMSRLPKRVKSDDVEEPSSTSAFLDLGPLKVIDRIYATKRGDGGKTRILDLTQL